MLDIIYNDAKDEHVANFVAYGKTSDSKLYYDAEYTTQVTKEDAQDAFFKGRLLVIDPSVGGAVAAIGVMSNPTGTTVLTVAMSGSPAVLTGTTWAVATE